MTYDGERFSERFRERAVRIIALTIGTAMCLGFLTGLTMNAIASSGTLNPPHSDFGLDTDVPPNGLYNELIVNVSVSVTVGGTFYYRVDLYDATGLVSIDSRFEIDNLVVGIQETQISFPGYVIRNSGFDGPYQVSISLFDDAFGFLDSGIHMTGAYNATDFDAPPAIFSPPHSEYVPDYDGDMLYDYLVVSANVTVNVSGSYYIEGSLLDSTGMNFITFQSNYTSLSTGNQRVNLAYLGYVIRSSGIDGPYRVELTLLDSSSVFLDNDTYFTNSYLATEFQNPPASFSPPHSDYPLDTNGDSEYEYLIISTSVDVIMEGDYSVEGLSSFGSAQNYTHLTVGMHTVDLMFYGYEIYNSGLDGPYFIDLQLYDSSRNLIDTGNHTTAAYLYTDFEQNPPCAFAPPHSDYGLDTDGDLFFDFLVVSASVIVDAPGFYEFDGSLYDSLGATFITSAANSTWLDIGPHTVDLLFYGPDIYSSGINGPYEANLQIYDENGNFLDSDIHMTSPYQYTDFDMPPAQFDPPHSDYAIDTDVPPDGEYNFLVVNASILVNDPGPYWVSSALLDSSFNLITQSQVFANLTAGSHLVALQFSGAAINIHGVDGPYTAWMSLYLIGDSGSRMIDMDRHVTGPYNYTNFTSLPPATIWGHVYRASDGTPVDFAQVWVSNYTHRFLFQTFTDPTGYYEVNAFDGDFYIMLDQVDLQADIVFQSVLGSTEVTRNLEDPVPNIMNANLSWSDWDNAILSGSMEGHNDNASMKFMIDMMIGNQDGIINQTELDLFMSLSGAAGLLVPEDTVDLLFVDGIHYDLIPGTDVVDLSSILGPIVPPRPLLFDLSGSFLSNTTIPLSNIHWVEVNVTYDTDTELYVYNGQLPPGFTLWDYIPETNVSISGIGSQNIVVDPLGDPDPFDPVNSVWANLTVGQGVPDRDAPLVLNLLLNDQPSLTYGISSIPPVVYLNATIDDSTTGNLAIGGANYTVGAQNWPGTAMSPSDGNFNTPAEEVTALIVPPTTTTTYCVYGWDVMPNYNTTGACATITVLDDVAPEISNILIDGAPSVTYSLSTAPTTSPLNATVDDGPSGNSMIGGANYTTPLVDSWPGIPMLAVDGAFDETWEDVGVEVPVPTSAGTFDYFVHAWDDAPNYNDSAPSVQITVIDDVDPVVAGVLLNGQPTISVMQGTLVTVEATIDDTGGRGDTAIQGANYTIDGDWAGSTPLDASDGVYDSPVEDVVSSAANSIDTTGWADGDYLVCVYGWDDVLNYNTTGECTVLNISSVDDKPPYVLNVLINNSASYTVLAGEVVNLTAVIDDTPAMGSSILGANYTVNMMWPGIDMFPTDGAFDTPTEDVNITIDTTGWAIATYQICVHGWDDVPNYNYSFTACAQLTVQAPPDTLRPTISNLRAEPDPQAPNENVRISADVQDNVQVSGVWINITDPNGDQVGNYSMTPGAGDEYYYEDNFDLEGSYNYTIWANDTSGNWASASDSFTIQELTPPTIDVTVDPETPRVGETVRFEAAVSDESGVDRVRIEVKDSSGQTILSNRSMTGAGGGVYEYELTFEEAGDYTYIISASDENGNWNRVENTITVLAKAGPSFFEEYWWLILVIVIVVVVVTVVAALLMRRKPKVVEMPPEVAEEVPSAEAPPEAPPAPPEEPVAPPEEETPPPEGEIGKGEETES